jgi:hypothetical protein
VSVNNSDSMKRNVIFLVITCLAFTMFSCKVSQETTVKKVSKDFLVYMNKGDFKSAKKLATPSSSQMIEMLESFSKWGLDSVKKKEYEIISCDITGDVAKCYYREDGVDLQLDLTKTKGKWLVDFKKEHSSEDASKAAANDSIAAANHEYEGEESDTTKLFDLSLTDMQNNGNFASVTFVLNNRSGYNIEHFWLKAYFSDKQGNFLQAADVMFNNVDKQTEDGMDPNPLLTLEKRKSKIFVENINPNDIGEIYISQVRISMEPDFYYVEETNFIKTNTNIRNSSSYKVTVTF